ncbi:MAG: hypothetical protein ABIE22_00140 [archaeon]
MVKNQTHEQKPNKNCFGTKEWSNNSGICRGCKFKEDCGKARAK